MGAEAADAVVAAARETEYGREARRIGFVTAAHLLPRSDPL